MTEAEWLACADLQTMLQYLGGSPSARKLRLFAVACCRSVDHLLFDLGLQEILAQAEKFADGLAPEEARSSARKAAQQAAQTRATTSKPDLPKWPRRAASAVYYATARHAWEAAWNTRQLVEEAIIWEAGGYNQQNYRTVLENDRRRQMLLLRDIFGNPFRNSGSVTSPTSPTVITLAEAIYTDRTFDRLPILADALEEAGCSDADILGHCRGPGPHVRGCWVVDLILSKDR